MDSYKLHAWPKVQLAFVRRRDGAHCQGCGARPKKWLGAARTSLDRETRARFTRVRRVSALELDHATPLWSVAHLPPDERRPFHGPSNLRLLCPACHGAKTAREAGERAEQRRAPPA